MGHLPDVPSHAVTEMDLRELARALRDGRKVIALTTGVCLALAAGYALVATKIFRSEVLVQVREETDAPGSLGGLLGQLGGLADLAGVSMGGGSDRAVAIATLRSRSLIEAFIKQRSLLSRLYSGDPPSVWEAYQDFTDDVFFVSEDKATGLVTVAIEWKDPTEAQEWVTDLVARANAHLRAQAIQGAEKNLAYLQQQIRTTGQVELQQALYGLVEAQSKKLMLAKGGDEFVLRTVDAAVVPTEPERPKRLLVVAFGALFGVAAGTLWVFLRRTWELSGAGP